MSPSTFAGQVSRHLGSLISGSPSCHWLCDCTIGSLSQSRNLTHREPACVCLRVRMSVCVLFCCIFTPVEIRQTDRQIPSVIFGAQGNIFPVVIHPVPDKFTWLPSNSLPNAVQLLLCRLFFLFLFFSPQSNREQR